MILVCPFPWWVWQSATRSFFVPERIQPGESGADLIGPARALPYQFTGVSEAYDFRDVELPLNSPGLLLLRKLRDEAHRFALSFHRKIRDKRMTGSAIEEIPGIGPRRRRLLLRTFGSVEGIRRATVDELAAVPTMTRKLADQVNEYLREG